MCRMSISLRFAAVRILLVGRIVEASLCGMTVTAEPVFTRNSTAWPLILQETYNNFSEVLTPDTEG